MNAAMIESVKLRNTEWGSHNPTPKELQVPKVTRATKMLEQAGIAFTVHSYNYDPAASRIGLQAAEALGEEPGRVLKTLMALVDGKPVCVIIPSDNEVSMKKLAAAFERKIGGNDEASGRGTNLRLQDRRHQPVRSDA